LTTHYAAGFGTAAVLWLVAALAPAEFRFLLWALALVIDLGTPIVSWRHSEKFPPNAGHLPERFGLFTIILLGESVASVMRGIESQEYWSLPAATAAFTGLTLSFALWWWYFDGTSAAAERHIRSRKEALVFQLWSFVHLPLYLAIGVAGVGVEHVISLQPGAHLHMQDTWILCGSIAVLMSAMVTLGATSESFQRTGRIRQLAPRYGVALLPLLAGFIGEQVPPVFLVIILTAITLLQVVLATCNMFEDHSRSIATVRDQAPSFGEETA
jgi:low temperature requirement protein LtrA